MTLSQQTALFLLQIGAILFACRCVGWIARRFGQPAVIGEMIAGVLLGPSVLGLVWPQSRELLFPESSRSILYLTAQIGVGLYMFLVGLEFRIDIVKSRARTATAISILGMIVPFILGALVAIALKKRDGYFASNITSVDAALFLGAAVAITALPVLARIIHERNLSGTPIGVLALAAAAINDLAAWCILAIVLASFGGGSVVAIKAMGGGVIYTVLILTLGRRIFARLDERRPTGDSLSMHRLSIILAAMMFCCALTEYIGIHLIFGAFVLGVAMPRGSFAQALRRSVEPLTIGLLLPIFFAFSGFNTRFDLMTGVELWIVAIIVLFIATLGKLGACWATARLLGEDNRTAFGIGSLMNARGLTELIILNVGLQHGLITPELFSIMVLMAIVTTLATTPLFNLTRTWDVKLPVGASSKIPNQIQS